MDESYEDQILEEDPNYFYAAEFTPPRRVRKKKIGKLAGVTDLPIDVLYEIFGNLLPYDLLRLSRTNREFRRLLIRRSATSVWKTSFERAPSMPPTPPDMNEPQWAHLVFDPYCHVCYAPNVRNIAWEWGIRVCVKCMKTHTVDRNVEDNFILPPFGEFPLVNMVSSRPGADGFRKFLLCDIDRFEEAYNVLLNDNDRAEFISNTFESVTERSKHAALCEEWQESSLLTRQQEQDKLREDRLNDIFAKLEELGWGDELTRFTEQDKEAFAEQPLVKKAQKLTPRVWSNIQTSIIQYMEEFRERRLLNDRCDLVERRMAVMAEVLRKLKNERLPLVKDLPNPVDFSCYDCVTAIFDQPGDAELTEDDFLLHRDALNEVLDFHPERLRGLLMDYLCAGAEFHSTGVKPDDEAISDGAVYARQGHGSRDWTASFPEFVAGDDPSAMLSRLQLATTVFSCEVGTRIMKSEECRRPIFWPELLNHSCLNAELGYSFNINDWLNPLEKVHNFCKKRIPWSPKNLFINYRLSHSAASIVSAAGKDVDTTTAEEMDALTDRFVCLVCLKLYGHAHINEEGRRRYLVRALPWREAVHHFAEIHCDPKPKVPQWQRMSLDEVVNSFDELRLVLAGSNQLPRHLSSEDPRRIVDQRKWNCTHCRDLVDEVDPKPKEDMEDHLKDVHGVEAPVCDQDYFIAPGFQPPFYGACTVRLREEELVDHVTVVTIPEFD